MDANARDWAACREIGESDTRQPSVPCPPCQLLHPRARPLLRPRPACSLADDPSVGIAQTLKPADSDALLLREI